MSANQTTAAESEITADKVLDILGKQCPMTYVYTKVTLEKMAPGEVLQVIVDFQAAFTNIPKSVVKQKLGEVIKERGENGIKSIWIRRI